MRKIYYKEIKGQNPKKKRVFARLIGILLLCVGVSLTLYIFTPLILWQIFISPALASAQIIAPIPKDKFVTPATIQTLLTTQVNALSGVDFYDAKNWFPSVPNTTTTTKYPSYLLSIPRLNITNAKVSTVDTDLAHHLVQFPSTAIPPEKGNTVIVGHSTLPSLYNPKDYKTIFAYAHTLQVGDLITVHIANIVYTYKIFSITIVDPDNSSIFAQPIDDSYLTIVTCTPPGTIWKRLIISARIQNI